LLEESCFQQAGSSAVEGTNQAVVGSSDQWKVLANLSPFLKSEKIPALLYLGKGPAYKPFGDFRPVPSAYQTRAQISNHGRSSGPLQYITQCLHRMLLLRRESQKRELQG
jgi:hypothetical protein